MRKLLKCPVTVALLILWAALSVVGYLGKDTIYKNYTVDIRTTPYFVLVFDGLHDGIFPWSHGGAPGGIGENGKLPSILGIFGLCMYYLAVSANNPFLYFNF